MSNEKWCGLSTELDKVKDIQSNGAFSSWTGGIQLVDNRIDITRHVNANDQSKLLVEPRVHDCPFLEA